MKGLDLNRIDLGPNADEIKKVLKTNPGFGDETDLVPPHRMEALPVGPEVDPTTPSPESLFCHLEDTSGLSGLKFSPVSMIKRAEREEVAGVFGDLSRADIKNYQGGPICPLRAELHPIDSVDDGPKPFVTRDKRNKTG